jgi:hypothetical protein
MKQITSSFGEKLCTNIGAIALGPSKTLLPALFKNFAGFFNNWKHPYLCLFSPSTYTVLIQDNMVEWRQSAWAHIPAPVFPTLLNLFVFQVAYLIKWSHNSAEQNNYIYIYI